MIVFVARHVDKRLVEIKSQRTIKKGDCQQSFLLILIFFQFIFRLFSNSGQPSQKSFNFWKWKKL